jgi:putative transcriptional regulator
MRGQFLLFVRQLDSSRFLPLLYALLAFSFAQVSADTLSAKESFSLKGMFLVAQVGMRDPRFAHSVLLITKHDSQGAIALIINHPTRISLSRALPDIAELANSNEKLFIGGPMAGAPYMLLIRSSRRIRGDATWSIFEDVYLSINADLIPRVMNQSGSALRVYSGFASWAPGQLESELERGGWHLESADAFTIFEKTSSRIWSDLSNTRESPKWINHECETDDCYAPGDNAVTNAVHYGH